MILNYKQVDKMVPKDGEIKDVKASQLCMHFQMRQNRHMGECFTPNSLGFFITTIAATTTAAASTITTCASKEEKSQSVNHPIVFNSL